MQVNEPLAMMKLLILIHCDIGLPRAIYWFTSGDRRTHKYEGILIRYPGYLKSV